METGHMRTFAAGLKIQPPSYSFSSRDYEQFQLIYISEGRLYFRQDGEEKKLTPGYALVLRAGSAFDLRTDGKSGYRGIFFAQYCNLQPDFHGRAAACLATPLMRQLAEAMREEAAAPGSGADEVLLGLGQSLAWLAVRQTTCALTARDGREYERYWAERARQCLDANLFTGLGAQTILAEFSLSYRQLARHFHLTYGQSPKQYLVTARLHEAERYLTETSLPITAIAYELGYPSSQHFAAQFAKHRGLSPSACRKGK